MVRADRKGTYPGNDLTRGGQPLGDSLPATRPPAERPGTAPSPQRGYRSLTDTRVGRVSLEWGRVTPRFLSARTEVLSGRGSIKERRSYLTRWTLTSWGSPLHSSSVSDREPLATAFCRS